MSKMGRLESDCDPNSITIIRKHAPPIKTLKSSAVRDWFLLKFISSTNFQEVCAAQRRGVEIETSKKYAAGGNKQHRIDKNTAKLDDETEELHHERVPLTLGKVLQQARQAKEWTQKDLATVTIYFPLALYGFRF